MSIKKKPVNSSRQTDFINMEKEVVSDLKKKMRSTTTVDAELKGVHFSLFTVVILLLPFVSVIRATFFFHCLSSDMTHDIDID